LPPRRQVKEESNGNQAADRNNQDMQVVTFPFFLYYDVPIPDTSKMLNGFLSKVWQQACTHVLFEMNSEEIGWLLRPHDHISLLATRRTAIIVTRIRLLVGLFALLTPLWIIFDAIAFPPQLWHELAVARLAATLACVGILLMMHHRDGLRDAYRALALLLAVPMAFSLFTSQHIAQFEFQGMQAAFSTSYGFLPFVLLAGLSIFPLTVVEWLACICPVLAFQVFASFTHWPMPDWSELTSIWLLLLIGMASMLAGLSQLAFMIVLIREAVFDNMTGCFSRHSGEKLVELQFTQATRSNFPLAMAFIDIDRFKKINDCYGHEVGDSILVNVTTAMRSHLRMGDMLIRWGGEEFLLMMPHATKQQACAALLRLRKNGFGLRPAGKPVTASIGVAELTGCKAENWQQLVELADSRMYAAKKNGRDCIVGCDQQQKICSKCLLAESEPATA